jgi:hypothetical protein
VKLPLAFHRLGVAVARNPLPGFDPIYYRYWYRDIAAFGAGPLIHYLEFGWREGRDPSAGFSTDGYLDANPDVVAAKINPLVHFLEEGLAAGRTGWQKDPRAPAPPARLVDQPMKLLAPPVAS